MNSKADRQLFFFILSPLFSLSAAHDATTPSHQTITRLIMLSSSSRKEETIIEDDVLAEQRRESVVSTFLAQKRADLQKLRDYSTDFRGLSTMWKFFGRVRRRRRRLHRRRTSVGKAITRTRRISCCARRPGPSAKTRKRGAFTTARRSVNTRRGTRRSTTNFLRER